MQGVMLDFIFVSAMCAFSPLKYNMFNGFTMIHMVIVLLSDKNMICHFDEASKSHLQISFQQENLSVEANHRLPIDVGIEGEEGVK